MQLSTRCQWQSTNKAINHGTTVSEATLEISPEIVVTAIVSKALFKHRGLKVSVAKPML